MIMNANKIFGVVLLGHILAVILIFFQPGCQSTERPALRTQSGTVPVTPATTGTAQADDPDVWSSGETRTAAVDTSRGRATPRRPLDPMEDDFGADQGGEPLRPLTPAPTPRTPVTGMDWGDTARPSGATYEVVRGDNLSTIARRHNVSLNALLEANRMNRDAVIRPGDQLIIPAGGTAPTAAPTSPAPSAPAAARGETEVYVVQRGDTLSGIAAARGTSVARLRELNSLRGDTIRVDQELRVPARSGATPRPATPAPGASGTPRPATGATYTVQAGDTPGGIANRFGVSTEELMRVNNISDPRRMRVGQELRIPGQAEEAPRTPSTPATTRPADRTPTTPATPPAPLPAPSDRALPIPFGDEDFLNDEDFPEVELVPED